MTDTESPAPWYLYTIYAVDGRRMYVGITNQSPPERRIGQHSGKIWWAHVDQAATDIRALRNGRPMFKWEAENIERRAIQRDGGTLANKEHNGSKGREFEAFLQAGGQLAVWPPERSPVPAGHPTAVDPLSSRLAQRGAVIAAGLAAGVGIAALVAIAIGGFKWHA